MSAADLDDDDYEEWKQIDGFFASMGVDGELTEESVSHFLKKGNGVRRTSVGDWLDSFGLGIYENVLVANGFDSTDLLNGGVLEETDLHLMGFTDIEHINRVLVEVSYLPSLIAIDVDNPPASVSEWLSALCLDEYTDKFYMLDYGTMARVLQIWEVELAMVLSVVLLGHQKRILVSLGDSRPGFNTMRRKQRANISDVSQVLCIKDLKVDSTPQELFKDNFVKRQLKESDETFSEGSVNSHSQEPKSPASSSIADSDSGCSIASDSLRLDTVDETTPDTSNFSLSIPSLIPNSTTSTSPEHSSSPLLSSRNSTLNTRQPADGLTYSGTKASYNRSQSAKHITKTVIEAQSKFHTLRSLSLDPGVQGTQASPSSDSSDTADYANLTESGAPLIGNVEGLKLSKTRAKANKLNSRRPLPDLPTEKKLSFTSKDLPKKFKGKHNPKVLIEGFVNYSACYLGTCQVNDTTQAGSTREAIARMKAMTQAVKKLPIVTLSISFKGVHFIDSSTQRAICQHEITNIYCAAQDSASMNYFAYITNDALTNGLYCHVFCVKSEDLARQVIMTLGEAFDIAFYAIQKHPSLLEPDV